MKTIGTERHEIDTTAFWTEHHRRRENNSWARYTVYCTPAQWARFITTRERHQMRDREGTGAREHRYVRAFINRHGAGR